MSENVRVLYTTRLTASNYVNQKCNWPATQHLPMETHTYPPVHRHPFHSHETMFAYNFICRRSVSAFFSLSLASTASFRMLKLTHSIISNTKCCAWHLIKTIYVAHSNWRASKLLPMEFIGNLWWNQQWNWKCSKNRFRVFATTSAFVYLRFYQHN